MAGWFKPKQKSDDAGEIAQSVYPLQDTPIVEVCTSCGGKIFQPGEYDDLCLPCFTDRTVSRHSRKIMKAQGW